MPITYPFCLILVLLLATSGCSSIAPGVVLVAERVKARTHTRTQAPQETKLTNEQRRQIEAYQTEGQRLFEQRRYAEAVTVFSAAVDIVESDLSPRMAGVYVARGWAHAKSYQPALALRDFQTALQIDPEAVGAHIGQAELHKARMEQATTRSGLANNEYAAYSAYSYAIRLRPEDPALYYGRATTIYFARTSPLAIRFAERRAFTNCVNDLTQAIQLKPDFAEAYVLRALAREKLDDVHQAAVDADQALVLRPDYAEAYFARAVVADRYRNGRPRAIAYARKALELDPGNRIYAQSIAQWERNTLSISESAVAIGALILGLAFLGALTADDAGSSSASSDWPSTTNQQHDMWDQHIQDILNDALLDID